jgi:rhodanese-related sulfurtransferase
MAEQKIQECLDPAALQQMMKQSSADQFTIIDVRNPDEYAEKHIPGAINIPLSKLEIRSMGLSKQTLIITVCGKGGGRSAQAAEKLKQLGFVKAIFLCDGTFLWYESQPVSEKS